MKENHKILRNFFTKEKCANMARSLDDLMQRQVYRNPDTQCKLSPAFYGIFNNELDQILKLVESAAEEELYPCYSYARIYQEGDLLAPHVDRPGAEISFTVTLDYDKYIWPFWLQEQAGFINVELDVGDALIYKGPEVSHFRHPMHGQEFQYQAFFHYVKKHGDFVHLKYDERDQLLTNQQAEAWNFPDWSDHKFKQDRNSIINRVNKGHLQP